MKHFVWIFSSGWRKTFSITWSFKDAGVELRIGPRRRHHVVQRGIAVANFQRLPHHHRDNMRRVHAPDLVEKRRLPGRLELFSFQPLADVNQHIHERVIAAVLTEDEIIVLRQIALVALFAKRVSGDIAHRLSFRLCAFEADDAGDGAAGFVVDSADVERSEFGAASCA